MLNGGSGESSDPSGVGRRKRAKSLGCLVAAFPALLISLVLTVPTLLPNGTMEFGAHGVSAGFYSRSDKHPFSWRSRRWSSKGGVMVAMGFFTIRYTLVVW